MEYDEAQKQCVIILSLQSHLYCRGIHDIDRFLRAFVEQGNDGIICPHLQEFTFRGQIDFPLEPLRIFLEAKQGGIALSMDNSAYCCL